MSARKLDTLPCNPDMLLRDAADALCLHRELCFELSRSRTVVDSVQIIGRMVETLQDAQNHLVTTDTLMRVCH